LPDVAQLANLANAFFSALPGQLPGSASGANGLNLDVAGPQLCSPEPAALDGFGRGGPHAYAVPEGYGAAIPQLAAAQPSPRQLPVPPCRPRRITLSASPRLIRHRPAVCRWMTG
jgi:cysteine desulfurase/selenocysteine lyase